MNTHRAAAAALSLVLTVFSFFAPHDGGARAAGAHLVLTVVYILLMPTLDHKTAIEIIGVQVLMLVALGLENAAFWNYCFFPLLGVFMVVLLYGGPW